MNAPFLTRDALAVGRWLESRLPGFQGPCELIPIAGGRSNPTFRLQTPAQAYVLRRKPDGPLAPSAHQIEREYRVLSALDGTAMPVPRALAFCENPSLIGAPFYVMSHVDGLIEEDPRLPQTPAARRGGLYRDAAKVAATLHGLDPEALGLADFGRPDGYMARQIRRWGGLFREAQTRPAPEMEALEAWLLQHGPGQGRTSLVHGDFRFGNLMAAPDHGRLVAVLDWELSTLGDPLCDLAYLAMPYRVPPGEAPLDMLAGLDPAAHALPSEAELLDAYCAAAGRPVPADWPAYLAFSFFRCAAIAQGVRSRAGAADHPTTIATVRSLALIGLDVARGG